jgi:hypothetical protein
MKRRGHQARLFNQWKNVPVGTHVIVTMDNGSKIQTTTLGPPELLGGHTAVIWLAGMRGCYSLERVALAVDP